MKKIVLIVIAAAAAVGAGVAGDLGWPQTSFMCGLVAIIAGFSAL